MSFRAAGSLSPGAQEDPRLRSTPRPAEAEAPPTPRRRPSLEDAGTRVRGDFRVTGELALAPDGMPGLHRELAALSRADSGSSYSSDGFESESPRSRVVAGPPDPGLAVEVESHSGYTDDEFESPPPSPRAAPLVVERADVVPVEPGLGVAEEESGTDYSGDEFEIYESLSEVGSSVDGDAPGVADPAEIPPGIPAPPLRMTPPELLAYLSEANTFMLTKNVENMGHVNTHGDIHYVDEMTPPEHKDGMANPLFFDKPDSFTFVVKPGQSAAKALQAFFDGETITECHSAMMAVFYKTMLDTVGSAVFDELFGKEGEPPAESLARVAEGRFLVICDINKFSELAGDTGIKKFIGCKRVASRARIKVGEWGYFQNHPAYSAKHPTGLMTGENAMLFSREPDAEDQWSGFGMHRRTEESMLNSLFSAYNSSRTDSDENFIIQINAAKIAASPELEEKVQALMAEMATRLPDEPMGHTEIGLRVEVMGMLKSGEFAYSEDSLRAADMWTLDTPERITAAPPFEYSPADGYAAHHVETRPGGGLQLNLVRSFSLRSLIPLFGKLS
jgi:hypothetical protein